MSNAYIFKYGEKMVPTLFYIKYISSLCTVKHRVEIQKLNTKLHVD